MKRGIILSVFVFAIGAAAAFASSQSVVKETRDEKNFTSVNFGVAGNLYITIGPEFKVVLEGERRFLDDIITEVSGNKLVIKKENWRFNLNEKITAYVTMPEVKGLGVSGSGKAEIKDALKTDDLNLSVSGSGKIFINDITVSKLDCGISGSGDIIFTGSGNANRADISISGNCTCNVTESLRASVSGSGNVTYAGDPKVDAHVSGSGKVRSR